MDILTPWYPAGRDLVLVGHDIQQDVKYLSSLGVDMETMKFTHEIDSQALHRSWRQTKDGRGLEHVLSELCIPSKNLHNAGNDAVYTLRAAIGVAVEDLRDQHMTARGETYVPALFAEGGGKKRAWKET